LYFYIHVAEAVFCLRKIVKRQIYQYFRMVSLKRADFREFLISSRMWPMGFLVRGKFSRVSCIVIKLNTNLKLQLLSLLQKFSQVSCMVIPKKFSIVSCSVISSSYSSSLPQFHRHVVQENSQKSIP